MSETLDIGIEESVDFAKEAQKLASDPKESYIPDSEIGNGEQSSAEGTEYREAEQQAQQEEINGAQQNVYKTTAKGIMVTENTAVPRLLAHLNKDEIGRYKLQKEEVEDLSDALALCLEHEGWKADSPWVYFFLQYGSYRGIQYYEGRAAKLKREKVESVTPRPAPTANAEHNEPPPPDISEDELAEEQAAKNIRLCQYEQCDKPLKGAQTMYCGPSHRSKQAAINRKRAKEDGEA